MRTGNFLAKTGRPCDLPSEPPISMHERRRPLFKRVTAAFRAATKFSGSQARLTFFVSGGDFTSIRRKHSLHEKEKSAADAVSHLSYLSATFCTEHSDSTAAVQRERTVAGLTSRARCLPLSSPRRVCRHTFASCALRTPTPFARHVKWMEPSALDNFVRA